MVDLLVEGIQQQREKYDFEPGKETHPLRLALASILSNNFFVERSQAR